jgi:hypothetical protein
MRLLFIAAVLSLVPSAATAHPHAGGIVVKPDGTVLLGDILQSWLLVIETTGAWRALDSVGHVRDLELAADGIVCGVSQGSGLWSIGNDEKVHPILADFHGLFARRSDGTLVLAPADSLDNRPILQIQKTNGQRLTLATFRQIDALAAGENSLIVADGSALRMVDDNGNIRTLVDDFGTGLYGVAPSPWRSLPMAPSELRHGLLWFGLTARKNLPRR